MSHKRRLDGPETLLLTRVERRIHDWPSAVLLLVCSCFVTKRIIKIQIPRRRTTRVSNKVLGPSDWALSDA